MIQRLAGGRSIDLGPANGTGHGRMARGGFAWPLGAAIPSPLFDEKPGARGPRIANLARPFLCATCGARYVSQQNLSRHRAGHPECRI